VRTEFAPARLAISFRLGLTDAEMLAGEFYPFFSAKDLINLPNYHIYLKFIMLELCRNRLVRRLFLTIPGS
jgi:hypothetical protein